MYQRIFTGLMKGGRTRHNSSNFPSIVMLGSRIPWLSRRFGQELGIAVAEAATPTLEDLREVPEPAWLWDGARARIVWANAAGISYFGGKSLFDLIDRPFDFLEPGVE